MRKLVKPTIKMDWDENRRIVTNQRGEKFVLFKENAYRVYNAAKSVYKKTKARMK